jgi:hypothetical protein
MVPKIDKNNQIPINMMITLAATARSSEGVGNNINGIDGQLANTGQNALMSGSSGVWVLLYMEATGKNKLIVVYFTQGDNISYQVDAGRMYGTMVSLTLLQMHKNDATIGILHGFN